MTLYADAHILFPRLDGAAGFPSQPVATAGPGLVWREIGIEGNRHDGDDLVTHQLPVDEPEGMALAAFIPQTVRLADIETAPSTALPNDQHMKRMGKATKIEIMSSIRGSSAPILVQNWCKDFL
jgi:hypothetical protein